MFVKMLGITNTKKESMYKERFLKRELKYYSFLKITWEKDGKVLTAEGNKLEDFVEIKDGDMYKIHSYVLSGEGIENEEFLNFIYDIWTGDEEFFRKLKYFLATWLEYVDYYVEGPVFRIDKYNVDYYSKTFLTFSERFEFSFNDFRYRPVTF
jgi:hypothetical protein